MLSNKKFWNSFYKINKIQKNSNFAKFTVYKKKNSLNILDLGCGNGRDAFYFANFFKHVLAIDRSGIAVKQNNKINKFKNLSFKKADIINAKLITNKKFDNIYARFFLHTLSDNEENIFFKNIKKIMKKKALVYLEFRTIKDPMIKKGIKISKNERFTDHYRRFIDLNDFKNRIIEHKLKILYLKESNLYSVYKNQKPHLARVILVN
jgi:SAM-dependent methyltransferase